MGIFSTESSAALRHAFWQNTQANLHGLERQQVVFGDCWIRIVAAQSTVKAKKRGPLVGSLMIEIALLPEAGPLDCFWS